MSVDVDLLQAITDLETMLRQSAELPQLVDNAHRKEGIVLRRRISLQIARVSETAGAVFVESEQQREFRSEFSKMRAAIALHQASWPIVSINQKDPAYQTSVTALREVNRRFFACVRSRIDRV